MSEHHFITVKINSPNTEAAVKAAQIVAAHSNDRTSLQGCHETTLDYWAANDGDVIVEHMKELSAAFTTETFEIEVAGPAGLLSYQGGMTIQNGKIISDSPSEDEERSTYEEL